MKELADSFGLSFLAEPWLSKALLAIFATVVLNFVADRLLRRLALATKKTPNAWDDILFNAARRPLPALIWVVGLAFAAGLVRPHADDPWFDMVAPLRDIGVMVCLAWFVFCVIRLAGDHYVAARIREGEEVDRTTVDALSKLGRLTVLISAGLVILQTLGFSVSGVLAAGGIGGIAIGFAAKDLLANFFGGLTIYLDRPFSVGEWIRSPDKQIEGTVEAISWRHTRIRAFNKNPIYVPNALFTTIVVENPSRMSNRRIKETIGIRYADIGKMAAIVADVKAMLQAHPEIDATQTLIVNFNEFADSSLNFMIYTFTKTTLWVHFHAVKQDILLQVADIIARHGAEIAFPTRTLHIENTPAQAG
ncbi:MAG: mechanosensitive ion channel family protein [Gammaproteobacteria bacterium]|nr:mechanosensitive ion channel family protein [Rhodocyclaceae bacterium]MBU3909302.1 mechanosensitive ion channel family protein [Gammaproteobacteria bacterium]MBU3989707.1 mechanosensitive ion channel family protein [Gammaproteobacteria bacterium]MBU4005538.1 mechanosensitive ion channel family protein [Gammaproteobacteria bacterium]MBU4020909.1 mechanosensitive ion channel family protein [Gammaproteobacteria bacterium]